MVRWQWYHLYHMQIILTSLQRTTSPSVNVNEQLPVVEIRERQRGFSDMMWNFEVAGMM